MSWFQSFEIRAGRRADGVEPAADVYLRMSFAAEMACSIGVCSLLIPAQNGELGVTTLNYEPVQRVVGDGAADFATEFLE
jgi:hypothetical protein